MKVDALWWKQRRAVIPAEAGIQEGRWEWIPACGELYATCDQYPYECHSERSEESKVFAYGHRSFADRDFGFFTPLRSVQNDSVALLAK